MDGPSGIDFTNGAVPGAAIRADLTVTFGWPKLGLLRFPARSRCGDIVCVEIGFPPPDLVPAARAITASWARHLLGDRAADAHKGEAGYLTILGAREGMAGAVILAARAAIRSGVGIVRVASAPGNREVIQTGVPSAIFVDWEDESALREAVEWCDALAIGPGLGQQPGVGRRVRLALGAAPVPAVLDADGLNVWGSELQGLANREGPVLATPHPGEMSRLLDRPIAEIKADPGAAALDLARAMGGTTTLKGAPTWVAAPDGSLRVTTALAPAFASGGMGDVLTGACGALMAAGLEAADAATVALTLTGIAAAGGDLGLGSADIPDRLPAARAALSDLAPGAWAGVPLALPAADGEPE